MSWSRKLGLITLLTLSLVQPGISQPIGDGGTGHRGASAKTDTESQPATAKFNDFANAERDSKALKSPLADENKSVPKPPEIVALPPIGDDGKGHK